MYQLATRPLSLPAVAVLRLGPTGHLFEPVPWFEFAEALRGTLTPGAECPRCQGTGDVADEDDTAAGVSIDCPLCDGTGVLADDIDPDDQAPETIISPAEYRALTILDATRLNAVLAETSPADAWEREPTLDLRIRRGDDCAGNAWRNRKTGALIWTAVNGYPEFAKRPVFATRLEHAA